MLSTSNVSQAYRQVLEQIAMDGVTYIANFDDSGGAPSVAPSARTGCVGMCFGTSTKKLYVYDGSAWIASVALS